MRKRKLWITVIVLVVVVVAVLGLQIWWALSARSRQIGKIKDEAAKAGRTPESLPGADEDYFADMDYGITKKHPEEVQKALSESIPNISPADAAKAAAIRRTNWIVCTAATDPLSSKPPTT